MRGANLFNRGFTLIELIVGMGLFSIVVSIAVGGFANALRSQRQAAALIEANSNASLAIEQMMREMRTGYEFCGMGNTSCANENEVAFFSARGETVKYCLVDNMIYRASVPKLFVPDCSAGGSGGPITAENVYIHNMKFAIHGQGISDGSQTLVSLRLGISPADESLKTNIINLQTSISPRTPDE